MKAGLAKLSPEKRADREAELEEVQFGTLAAAKDGALPAVDLVFDVANLASYWQEGHMQWCGEGGPKE